MKNIYSYYLVTTFILLFSFQSKCQIIDSKYFGGLKYGFSEDDVRDLDYKLYKIDGDETSKFASYLSVIIDAYDEVNLHFERGLLTGASIQFSWCKFTVIGKEDDILVCEECKRTLTKVGNDLTSRFGKPQCKEGIKTWLSSTSEITLLTEPATILLIFIKRK